MKRTSITLEDSIYTDGQKIAAKRGFSQSFSAYIAWLIQRDADGGIARENVTAKQPQRKSTKRSK